MSLHLTHVMCYIQWCVIYNGKGRFSPRNNPTCLLLPFSLSHRVEPKTPSQCRWNFSWVKVSGNLFFLKFSHFFLSFLLDMNVYCSFDTHGCRFEKSQLYFPTFFVVFLAFFAVFRSVFFTIFCVLTNPIPIWQLTSFNPNIHHRSSIAPPSHLPSIPQPMLKAKATHVFWSSDLSPSFMAPHPTDMPKIQGQAWCGFA